jgi:outer membrane protein assembly factor BamE (lipoprotein component of BamABCDE complex)
MTALIVTASVIALLLVVVGYRFLAANIREHEEYFGEEITDSSVEEVPVEEDKDGPGSAQGSPSLTEKKRTGPGRGPESLLRWVVAALPLRPGQP